MLLHFKVSISLLNYFLKCSLYLLYITRLKLAWLWLCVILHISKRPWVSPSVCTFLSVWMCLVGHSHFILWSIPQSHFSWQQSTVIYAWASMSEHPCSNLGCTIFNYKVNAWFQRVRIERSSICKPLSLFGSANGIPVINSTRPWKSSMFALIT